MRTAPVIVLSEADRRTLEKWAHGRSIAVRQAQRARIVLAASRGMTNHEIAAHLGINRILVGRWRSRFAELGLPGIEKDAPRGGRRPTQRNRVAREILRRATNTKPEDATHWTTRSLARELGASQSMVTRVLRAHGVKPHLVETFKVSNDPAFVEKVVDVVGLYLDPPEHAMVLCCDEKSQIQALDRTQPGLPIKKGRCGTMTHDYTRHGTTTLFSALDAAESRIIGTCMPRHRHQEWIKFLQLIDRETPSDLDLHLIVDNYATHKHAKVKAWLKRHPRFHIHFTPTASSWLNLVERWFRELTDKRIRRGVFRSVDELIEAITQFIQAHNENPRRFIWTAPVRRILDKVQRARRTLEKIQSA